HVAQGLMLVEVRGDVEWVLNRLDDGRWLVTLLNNRGLIKPEHGVLPTDQREAQTVQLRVPFAVARSEEWMTGQALKWAPAAQGAELRVTVPAAMVRMIAIRPARRSP